MGASSLAPMEWAKGDFLISCDPAKQDVAVIHGYLTSSYWAKGIPLETVKRSLQGGAVFCLAGRRFLERGPVLGSGWGGSGRNLHAGPSDSERQAE